MPLFWCVGSSKWRAEYWSKVQGRFEDCSVTRETIATIYNTTNAQSAPGDVITNRIRIRCSIKPTRNYYDLQTIKDRLVSVRNLTPQRMRTLKGLLPQVESLQVGASDVSKWLEEAEALLASHMIDGNINAVEDRIEKHRVWIALIACRLFNKYLVRKATRNVLYFASRTSSKQCSTRVKCWRARITFWTKWIGMDRSCCNWVTSTKRCGRWRGAFRIALREARTGNTSSREALPCGRTCRVKRSLSRSGWRKRKLS